MAKALSTMISDEMTTKEIFSAWDLIVDYSRHILASVITRLEETGYYEGYDEPTDEQEELVELQKTLEGMEL